MTTKHDETESVARAQRMGVRALQLAAASMIAIILVLTGSLAIVLGLTREARSDASRLTEELQCRSNIAADFDAAFAEAMVLFALSVTHEGVDPDPFIQDLIAAVEDLEIQLQRREDVVSTCDEELEPDADGS